MPSQMERTPANRAFQSRGAHGERARGALSQSMWPPCLRKWSGRLHKTMHSNSPGQEYQAIFKNCVQGGRAWRPGRLSQGMWPPCLRKWSGRLITNHAFQRHGAQGEKALKGAFLKACGRHAFANGADACIKPCFSKACRPGRKGTRGAFSRHVAAKPSQTERTPA